MMPYLNLLRPSHWVKNLLLFAPLIFSKQFLNLHSAGTIAMGFVIFSLLASAIYIVNDIIDCDNDREHPEKRMRPIAAGLISQTRSFSLALALVAMVLVLTYIQRSPQFNLIVVLYFSQSVLYSVVLKKIAIVDVLTLASGYILRVLAGGSLIHVAPSSWIILCTGMAALFLGFSKRRHELVTLEASAQDHRPVLSHYTPYLLDQYISVSTASTLLTYSLYCVSDRTILLLGNAHMIWTVPFVTFGIFRYLYLIHQREKGGNPVRLILTDGYMTLTIILWSVASMVIVVS
jgi:4-hydroxybenzoate polyprenyltransferase